MTMSRLSLFGALALTSSIIAVSFPANAARHQPHRSHILMAADGSHIHKAHVLDAVARRQSSPLHRSASLITRNATTASETSS